MHPALLVRLRPTGPWRFGPGSGAPDEAGELYHSDALYSAVTQAMASLGELDPWLDATARAAREPAVRFSSCFPCLGETLFIVPPRSLWPPPPSAKVRWKGARFVPLSLVRSLVAGERLDEEAWRVDPQSRCLLPSRPVDSTGPFRTAVRALAPVDRLGRTSWTARRTGCVEFSPEGGLWMVVSFAGEQARQQWWAAVEAALRLLADSGFGGKRSVGWGRAEMPEITTGTIPELLLAGPGAPDDTPPGEEAASGANEAPETAFWLLSLFSPGERDQVDWGRGSYTLITRSGRVESTAGWGREKKALRMVAEGSVLFAQSEPQGAAVDVAPDGFPHPVFRYGCPVSIPIPAREAA